MFGRLPCEPPDQRVRFGLFLIRADLARRLDEQAALSPNIIWVNLGKLDLAAGSGVGSLLVKGGSAQQRGEATRNGLTKVTRSMPGTEMQSAICRRDQGAQSGAADGG